MRNRRLSGGIAAIAMIAGALLMVFGCLWVTKAADAQPNPTPIPTVTPTPTVTPAPGTPTPTPIPIKGTEPHFYAADPKDGEYYFGPNALVEAEAKVEAGEAETTAEAASQNLFDRMIGEEPDPLLTATEAYYLDQKGLSGDEPILQPGENPNDACERYIANRADWEYAVTRVYNILHGEGLVEVVIVETNKYTSAMYMKCVYDVNGELIGIPDLIVKDTNGESGHLLIFRFRTEKDGEIIEVKLRLECGYQPVDVPPPPPRRRPTPTPTATPTPTPTPKPPTPTPKPKDPAKDPVIRNTDPDVAADIGTPSDPANHDQQRDRTPEPTSPSSFTNTVTPTPKPARPTATPTPKPTVSPTPRPTATPTLRPTAAITPSVEPAVRDDGINTGDVDYGDPDDR